MMYGDSRITVPYSNLVKDILKIKGGNNCYFVTSTINLQEIYEQHIRNKELEYLIVCVNLMEKQKTIN